MQNMGENSMDGAEIVRKSYEIVKKYVRGETAEEKILQRCIIATGDPAVKDLIVFKGDAVKAGVEALKSGKNIICDVKMVEVGINKRRIRSKTYVAVEVGRDEKMTRAMSGMYSLREKMDGAILAIGNAPSAAIAAYNLIKEGVKPSLVIATPVGFVNAAESKEMIRSLAVPSITTVGTRGGSAICVAIVNALIDLCETL